eukprot:8115846-Pyramimonas_sp.AAC.1
MALRRAASQLPALAARAALPAVRNATANPVATSAFRVKNNAPHAVSLARAFLRADLEWTKNIFLCL